ncbi:splicing factor 3a subunit 3 [Kalaharituber pfeilii]|nr:splicing factor 3a subunit 3 [Kalaharituber pfeilii]
MMILESERFIAEDLERLEQAIADRLLEEPKATRERLARDHQIARFVDRFQDQSKRLLELQRDADGSRAKEIESISRGDPFEEFYRQLAATKDFHRRYPNEPVENLERAYKRRAVEGAEGGMNGIDIDNMFTGEELNGRFLDMTQNHTEYLNLPGVKRITYLQYLSIFDKFDGFTRNQKGNDQYFQYLNNITDYLESFLRRTRPLSNPDRIMEGFDNEFEKDWEEGKITVFPALKKAAGPQKESTPSTANANDSTTYCDVCIKQFGNQKAYENHLPGRKHKKALAAKEELEREKQQEKENEMTDGVTPDPEKPKLIVSSSKLKERAIGHREFRVQKLAELLSKEREDTKVNVERKQSLTERERQMELEALLRESTTDPSSSKKDSDNDSENEDKIYNPLKLPLAWDGKPIPYWLYKLHGLGVEFPCEICGNFVYMGRRAFDKHFNEWRHTHGLRCLGITNTTLFREITKIDEAVKLWEKIQTDKKKEKQLQESVTEMEDEEGNVLPYQVWLDLKKQGLL